MIAIAVPVHEIHHAHSLVTLTTESNHSHQARTLFYSRTPILSRFLTHLARHATRQTRVACPPPSNPRWVTGGPRYRAQSIHAHPTPKFQMLNKTINASTPSCPLGHTQKRQEGEVHRMKQSGKHAVRSLFLSGSASEMCTVLSALSRGMFRLRMHGHDLVVSFVPLFSLVSGRSESSVDTYMHTYIHLYAGVSRQKGPCTDTIWLA